MGNRIKLFFAEIIKLCFKPKVFFKTSPLLNNYYLLYILFFIISCGNIIERIETILTKAEYGIGNMYISNLISTWPITWLTVFFGGLIGSFFYWHIGAWILRLIIRLAGHKKADLMKCRQLISFTGLIEAIPTILLLIYYSLSYNNYSIAFNAEESVFISIFLILPIWATIIRYKGATTLFNLIKWRAYLLFLFIPIFVYLLAWLFLATLL